MAAAAPIWPAETVRVLANRPERFWGCAADCASGTSIMGGGFRPLSSTLPLRQRRLAARRCPPLLGRMPLQHSEKMAGSESGGSASSCGRGTGRGAGAGGTGNGANHGAGVWRVGSGAGRRVAGAWGVGMGVGHSAGAWGVGHRWWYRRLGRWRRRVTAECRALLRW